MQLSQKGIWKRDKCSIPRFHIQVVFIIHNCHIARKIVYRQAV